MENREAHGCLASSSVSQASRVQRSDSAVGGVHGDPAPTDPHQCGDGRRGRWRRRVLLGPVGARGFWTMAPSDLL